MNEYDAAFKAGEAWARAGGDEDGLDAASLEYMRGKDDPFAMGWVFASGALNVMNDGVERIRSWPHTDFNGLMDFVIGLWQYPDYVEDTNTTDDFGKEVREVNISTGGWSGHEEIIGELIQNTMFWLCCWQMSRRGGHYRFHLPHRAGDGQSNS